MVASLVAVRLGTDEWCQLQPSVILNEPGSTGPEHGWRRHQVVEQDAGLPWLTITAGMASP